jgi:hypothetical protein
MLQGNTNPVVVGGTTVHLSSHMGEAVWRQSLAAIAVAAATRAAQAAAIEVRRQLRLADRRVRLPAASEATSPEYSRQAAVRQVNGAHAAALPQPQPEPDAASRAAARQDTTAVNAQELESALRLHGQVGNDVAVKTPVEESMLFRKSPVHVRVDDGTSKASMQWSRACGSSGRHLVAGVTIQHGTSCTTSRPQVRVVTQQFGVALLRDRRTRLAAATIKPRHRRSSDHKVTGGQLSARFPLHWGFIQHAAHIYS